LIDVVFWAAQIGGAATADAKAKTEASNAVSSNPYLRIQTFEAVY
jgi:NADH dehydrogenase FAD-containing subunit